MSRQTPRYKYEDSVFINCPFDSQYEAMFHAIVFAVYDCGFVPLCAKESEDSENRLEKIFALISNCRLAIHDISRIELSKNLPRFNMPFELGLFLGAQRFGMQPEKRGKEKACIILDSKSYRYQKTISDLNGYDIHIHGNNPQKAVAEVRNWLSRHTNEILPDGKVIHQRYRKLLKDLPVLCKGLKLNPKKISFKDYGLIVFRWVNDDSKF